jgi:hypothetical protein
MYIRAESNQRTDLARSFKQNTIHPLHHLGSPNSFFKWYMTSCHGGRHITKNQTKSQLSLSLRPRLPDSPLLHLPHPIHRFSPSTSTAPETMQATVTQPLPPSAFDSHPTDRQRIEPTHRCLAAHESSRCYTDSYVSLFSPLQIAFCLLAYLAVPFHGSTWPCRKPWPSMPRVLRRRPFQPRLQARCWRFPRLGLVQWPRSAVLPLKCSRFKFSHVHAILPSFVRVDT